MRALFVNDTGGESNPGCRAASAALRGTLAAAGYEVSALPLGYWAPEFRALDDVRRKALAYEGSRFPAWVAAAPDVDSGAWEALRSDLLAADAPLRELLAASDLVLINGEGSIHHNLPRALGLLALAASAASLGVRTHLVNATLQAMSPALLARVLPMLDVVHVRERFSLEVAARFAPRAARLSVDVAFAAPYAAPYAAPDAVRSTLRGATREAIDPAARPPREESSDGPEERCLLTAGVGVHPRYLVLQIETIRSAGWEPVYLLIGDGSEREVATAVCAEHGVEVVDAGAVPWQDFPAVLSRYPLAVSGRHHVNIFLLLAGVPLIPLPSNTWKIEGTLERVGYPHPPVATVEDLGTALAEVRESLTAWTLQARAAGRLGPALVTAVL